MEIELCAVSGYQQVGKNMTAIKIDDEVVIIDMGIDMSILAQYESEEGDSKLLSTEQLIKLGAVPDDTKILDWKHKVKAIVLGHCHLDHIAAVRYLAAKYKSQIIASPFTIEVLKETLKDEEITLPNKFTRLELDTKMKLTDKISIELISVTHSTLQCAIVAIHTEKGILVYGNDFKFDDNPIIGSKTNYKRLKELGESKKVISLVVESMYANREGHTPSEALAKEILGNVLLNYDHKGKAIFVTMFSSHIARIKSAVEFSDKLKRKTVILGRSMAKYNIAADKLKLIDYLKKVDLTKFGRERRKKMEEINSNRGKYLVICTGGQGEPGSILDKIVSKELPFKFQDNDVVIFSCSTIPQAINIANRERLEKLLEVNHVKIFTQIHVSGHGSAEDLREFIKMVRPKNLIPSQGENEQLMALVKIAEEEGYKLNNNIHLLKDGERLKLN